jgi:hypothetical protein
MAASPAYVQFDDQLQGAGPAVREARMASNQDSLSSERHSSSAPIAVLSVAQSLRRGRLMRPPKTLQLGPQPGHDAKEHPGEITQGSNIVLAEPVD